MPEFTGTDEQLRHACTSPPEWLFISLMPSRPPRTSPKDTQPKSPRWQPAPVPPGAARVFRVRITLLDTSAEIWRQVLVPADIRLDQMHGVIQLAMGWDNSHMHQFIKGAREVLFRVAGQIDNDGFSFPGRARPPMADEARVRLDQVLPAVGEAFGYEYDFGDSWEHAIEVGEILPRPADFKGPVCLAGERACPPEDCGGVPGFEDILRLCAKSADEDDGEDAERREWLGEFDPAKFDLAAVNRDLRRIKC